MLDEKIAEYVDKIAAGLIKTADPVYATVMQYAQVAAWFNLAAMGVVLAAILYALHASIKARKAYVAGYLGSRADTFAYDLLIIGSAATGITAIISAFCNWHLFVGIFSPELALAAHFIGKL